MPIFNYFIEQTFNNINKIVIYMNVNLPAILTTFRVKNQINLARSIFFILISFISFYFYRLALSPDNMSSITNHRALQSQFAIGEIIWKLSPSFRTQIPIAYINLMQ
jgi:hypothetical protein